MTGSLEISRTTKLSDYDIAGPVAFGPIEAMKLPEGWTVGKSNPDPESFATLKELHPYDAPLVALALFNRGFQISDQPRSALLRVLDAEPHALPASDLKMLSQVLGNLNDSVHLLLTGNFPPGG